MKKLFYIFAAFLFMSGIFLLPAYAERKCVGFPCRETQSGQRPSAFPEWGEPFQVQPGSPLDRLTHWLFDPILEAPKNVYQYGISIGGRVFLPGAMGGMTPAEELAADISGGFGAEISKFAAEVGIGEGMGGIRSGMDAVRQAVRGSIPQPLPVGAGIPGARVPGVHPPRGPVAGDPLGNTRSMDMRRGPQNPAVVQDVFPSRSAAFREAKRAYKIPVSVQPTQVVRPGTPEGKRLGLDPRNVRLYKFDDIYGRRIHIREDLPATYGSGGAGDQGPHFNIGLEEEKLKGHYYWGD